MRATLIIMPDGQRLSARLEGVFGPVGGQAELPSLNPLDRATIAALDDLARSGGVDVRDLRAQLWALGAAEPRGRG